MAKYFIQDTTLTNIADAIREKTGVTSALSPKNMPSYIRSIQTTSSDTTGIPDYVVTEGKRVASSMVAKRGANSITAVIMSDMHDLGDNDSTADVIALTRRGNLNAGQGAKVIADNIDLDFVANLGDLCFGAKTSKIEDFVQGIVNAKSYLHDVAKDHETFFTPGNHDTATYGFAQNGEYLSQGVLDALIGTYRYVDFTSKKVRVICLNTSEVEGLTVSGSTGTHRMTGTQLQWFADALDLSTKSDTADWGIIIMSHAPLDWDSSILPAANCLQAYLTGSNFSVTHNGVSVSKNFSGKNDAKVICQFHGHVHGFRVDNIHYGTTGNLQTMAVKRIAIPNAYFYRNNEYGENGSLDSNGLEFGETSSYPKTDGTAKNTAFCLVSIDLDDEVIYADCYGAGYDRVISYFNYGTFTNRVLTSEERNSTAVYNGIGYKNGVYCSDGGDSADSSIVTTGYIPYTWSPSNVLYIKGATLDTTNDHVRIYGFYNKTSVNSNVGYTSGSRITERFTVEALGNKYYKLTPKTTATGGLTHIRISLVGTGENLIVTVNEQIHSSSGTEACSITNNLTNVKSSNVATAIDRGSAYNATLTANTGYTLTGGTVKVTMGGTDITSSAYSGGNVSISNVTGNIVITATAVAVAAYTNRVRTSIDTDKSIYNGTGYKEGYRLNSSGVPAELEGAVHSGFIPYNGEVIRAWGTTNSSAGTSGNYIGLYDSNFAKIYVHGGSNYVSYGGTWTAKDGKYMVTVDPATCSNTATKSYLASAKYIRVSMPNCTGANLVVTLNEPI